MLQDEPDAADTALLGGAPDRIFAPEWRSDPERAIAKVLQYPKDPDHPEVSVLILSRGGRLQVIGAGIHDESIDGFF